MTEQQHQQQQSVASLRANNKPQSAQPPKRSMAEIAQMPRARQFPAMLESLQSEIRRALPAHLNPDRMARIALTCFRTTPKLAECEPASVFAAVLQASQLGLEPGLLGQCYLIPYNNSIKDDAGKWHKRMECQLQVGYQGLVDLARRSGRVVSLEAHNVYARDKFDLSFGMATRLEHTPTLDGDKGEFRLSYAVAHLKDGGVHVEVMTRAEIEGIRDRSQNVQSAKRYGKTTPWDTDFGEMARKTVLRRICKFLPKSVELAQAIELDTASAMGRAQDLNIDDAIEGTWTPVEHIEHDAPPDTTPDSTPHGGAQDAVGGPDGAGDPRASTASTPTPAQQEPARARGRQKSHSPDDAGSDAGGAPPTDQMME